MSVGQMAFDKKSWNIKILFFRFFVSRGNFGAQSIKTFFVKDAPDKKARAFLF
jgi:hypothetical protein